MKEVVTRLEISATPEQVWATLMDFASYPEWNPLIRFIDGDPEPGELLNVTIAPAGTRARHLRPVVQRCEPRRTFGWKRRGLVPGFFDREQSFTIERTGEARVQFVHRERFSGLLVPLFWGDVRDHTRRTFELMNRALKIRVEREQ